MRYDHIECIGTRQSQSPLGDKDTLFLELSCCSHLLWSFDTLRAVRICGDAWNICETCLRFADPAVLLVDVVYWLSLSVYIAPLIDHFFVWFSLQMQMSCLNAVDEIHKLFMNYFAHVTLQCEILPVRAQLSKLGACKYNKQFEGALWKWALSYTPSIVIVLDKTCEAIICWMCSIFSRM